MIFIDRSFWAAPLLITSRSSGAFRRLPDDARADASLVAKGNRLKYEGHAYLGPLGSRSRHHMPSRVLTRGFDEIATGGPLEYTGKLYRYGAEVASSVDFRSRKPAHKDRLMIRTLIFTFFSAVFSAASAAAAPVTFEWAVIGNAGNAGELSGDSAGGFGPGVLVGAVAYNYAISKHEVTNAQYAEFLNAVAATDSFALYNDSMSDEARGGITRSGAPGSYGYATNANMANKPVNYVSFFDAMRFTNWLHNGQGNGNTETGAYTIGNGANEVRSASAKYWIPSEDEWYKAAYHDATAGTSAVYFDYATGGNNVPVSDQPGDNSAAVNYRNDDGLINGFNDGYAVSGSPIFPSDTNPLTNVGAYTAAISSYGTFDQNGSVTEWNEAVFGAPFRGLRGGSWDNFSVILRADFRDGFLPTLESSTVGFRVASVPEPSTALLGSLAVCGLMMRRRI